MGSRDRIAAKHLLTSARRGKRSNIPIAKDGTQSIFLLQQSEREALQVTGLRAGERCVNAGARTLTHAIRSNADVDELKSIAIVCGLRLLLFLIAALRLRPGFGSLLLKGRWHVHPAQYGRRFLVAVGDEQVRAQRWRGRERPLVEDLRNRPKATGPLTMRCESHSETPGQRSTQWTSASLSIATTFFQIPSASCSLTQMS